MNMNIFKLKIFKYSMKLQIIGNFNKKFLSTIIPISGPIRPKLKISNIDENIDKNTRINNLFFNSGNKV